MRIRKNAATSVLPYLDAPLIVPPRAISSVEETRVCELNRSPWDFISFAPQSCPEEFQFEMNDGNTVRVESVNAVDSVGSLKEEDVIEEEDEEEEDEERTFPLLTKVDYKAKNKVRKKKKIGLNKQRKRSKESKNYVYCNKTDGKGWQCRREAKQGHSLCEHHLTQLRSYHYNYKTHSTLKSDDQLIKPTLPITTISTSRRRNRTNSSSSSSLVNHSTSPSDFYYYSGFGPLWGKKRLAAESATSSSSKSSSVDDDQKKQLADDDDTDDNHGDFDVVVDNDEEEEDEDDAPKKRFRKPIKARSLKSLF